MDKNTLSNYGWIVIAVLVLSVMIALATPFGNFVAGAIKSTTAGFFNVNQNALNSTGLITLPDQEFEEGYTGGQSTPAIDMSTVDATLENNDWATIQKVVKADKATEAGWKVGDTKTLEINGMTVTAMIIGVNHDGANTATFMIVSSGGIGYHVMNTDYTNAGGWEDSEMREWLNKDIYGTMSNKDYIKEVTKMTNNIGYNGNSVTGTQDKVFLLSPKEAGIEWKMADSNYWDWPDYGGMNALNSEGSTYTWFATNTFDGWFLLRSPDSSLYSGFFYYGRGSLCGSGASIERPVYPAFVIG